MHSMLENCNKKKYNRNNFFLTFKTLSKLILLNSHICIDFFSYFFNICLLINKKNFCENSAHLFLNGLFISERPEP